MGRKKMWIPILLAVLAAVLLTVLLWPGRDAQTPSGPVQTRPAAQNRTEPTQTEPTQTEPTQTEPTTLPQDPQTEPAEPTGTEDADAEPEETEPEETEPEATEPERTEPKATEPPLQSQSIFPTELEDGAVTVKNLFQFTGMNPDAENDFGENIAGLEMTNTSGRHIAEAEVTAVLTDGTILTFLAQDVPAGDTVLAFCRENASVKDARACEEVYGYVAFDDADPLRTDLVECTVDGTSIKVRNVSGTDLTNLKVLCHGLLDSNLYGGTTYQYRVSTLPAGASTTIQAIDCILGMAKVVRVECDS